MNNDAHLLIVEDSPTQAVEIQYFLEQNGYKVSMAEDGEQALAMLKDITPTIIISDIVMPRMNGYELCARIKENDRLKDIPVILLTSLSEPEDVINGLVCGASNFIVKPFDKKFMLARIQYILINREMRKGATSQMGIEIFFRGKRYFLSSERVQMIDLLLSTYEAAIQKNSDFKKANQELEQVKDELEGRVLERTAELTNSNVLLKREIDGHKQTGKALRESEERYRSMMEAMDEATYICSSDFRVEYMNPAMIKRAGYDAKGELCHKAIHGLDEKCPWCVFEKVIRGKSINHEIVSPKDNKTYQISNSPIVHTDGSVSKLTIFHDVTELKKMEAHFHQAQKMESIGTLAGGIAHDFNNILFPILGYSDMLLADIPEDSPFRDGLNGIHTSALRAKDLVRQILTFARQDTTEVILMKMQPVVKEALRLIRSTIPTTIDITLDIRADCGVIKADPTQIHQIVMNLATNAYHAMEDTGGELKASLKEVELGEQDVITPDMIPGNYACLTVSDTGTGMDKDVTEKIFDPFFTTKEIGKGTGMGLSVVHGIVKSMDGAIQVYSKPGEGTKFHVYLPVEKSSFEKQNIQTKEPVQGGIDKILLVDDEDAIITMEKRVLERLGYQVTSRTGSLEALEAFRANPDKFDVVITDLAMPNMPGDKLSAELIKIRPDIPILLCSGFSETMSEEKAASLGIKGFILKPIVMKDLAQKIREVLD